MANDMTVKDFLEIGDVFFIETLNDLAAACNRTSVEHGFYDNVEWNFGEKLALMHGELSEALECHRAGAHDEPCDKVPQISKLEEEFADVIIRVLDTAHHMKLNMGKAVILKMLYNEGRPYKHGKKY